MSDRTAAARAAADASLEAAERRLKATRLRTLAATNLRTLAKMAADAEIDLRFAIVAERAKGRTFRDIADECGMTPGGVQYVVRKALAE